MSSLFVKIFVWFWLAISLVVAVQAVLMLAATRRDQPTFPEMTGEILEVYGHCAAEILQREGCAGLDRLAKSSSRQDLQLHLFDERGHEVCGASVSKEATAYVQAAAQHQEIDFRDSPRSMFASRRVSSLSGDRYIALLQLRPPPRPPEVFVQLVAIIMTVGLVCYALARWLTDPLRLLSSATTRLAGGDMTARVGQKVTKRRDEIGTLGRDFDVMAGRVESLVSTQRQLLRDISHELRSPLARQMIAIDIARADCSPEAAEALGQMERDVRRLNELVTHLLTLSRLESGLRDENSSIDLAGLVRQISADADFEAQNRHRRVRVERCEPCIIRGEIELIRRAIENVVRNAVHYSDQDTEVQVSLERIKTPSGQIALLRVRDHGPGVPEAELGGIFQPFYRLGTARDRHSGGTGLGLAITLRAIELHGGSVSALNATDRGLIVAIQLPLDFEQDGLAAPSPM